MAAFCVFFRKEANVLLLLQCTHSLISFFFLLKNVKICFFLFFECFIIILQQFKNYFGDKTLHSFSFNALSSFSAVAQCSSISICSLFLARLIYNRKGQLAIICSVFVFEHVGWWQNGRDMRGAGRFPPSRARPLVVVSPTTVLFRTFYSLLNNSKFHFHPFIFVLFS